MPSERSAEGKPSDVAPSPEGGQAEQQPAPVVDMVATKARVREAIAIALKDRKIHRGSSLDAVRFQLDEALPAWAVKGAWEAACEAMDADAGQPTPKAPRREAISTIPTIRVVLGEPDDYIAKSVKSLKADPDLFVRDVDLVHVTRATEDEQDGSAWEGPDGETRHAIVEGSPKIHTMSLATLRVRMCRWAKWERTKTTKDGGSEQVQCEPTRVMAEEVRDEHAFPGIRPLYGVAESPFPRPDGTIVQGQPHYDPATHYLYEPSQTFEPVPEHPTPAQARESYAALADLFSDFPFASPAGTSAAAAALLTLLARPAIRGPTPAWVIDATTPGTGKTLLTDVLSAVAYGRESGRAHFPAIEGRDGDAELQKRLGMFARMGTPMVNFDNADDAILGGDVLEECISARDKYTFRILGKTEGMTLAMRIVFFMTANNASWSRGMNRRIIHVRLESTLENPEHRPLDTYRHPERAGRLFEYALESRAEYVRHALTLIRAYYCAGRPATLTLGTFEAWAALIPSAIVWAGGENPMLCRPSESGDESPDTLQRQTLAREWASFCELSTLTGVTSHDVIDRLYPDRQHGEPADPKWETLRGAIEYFVPCRPGQRPDPAKLSEVISKRFKGAPLRTHAPPSPLQRFAVDGKSGGRARWKLEIVPGGVVGVRREKEAEPECATPEHERVAPPSAAWAPAEAPATAHREESPEDAYDALVARLRAEDAAPDD